MERTWKPTAAGVLNIISGVMGIAFGILVLVVIGLLGTTDWGSLIQQWDGWIPDGMDVPGLMGGILGSIGTIALVLGIIALVFGIIALVGGITSLRRRRWGLALTGSILSLFIIPIGTVLGILAIIFVSMGKKEFS